MPTYNQDMRTIQDIYLSFCLKNNSSVVLSSDDAEVLNDMIVHLIDKNIKGNEDILYIEDGGFDPDGCIIDDTGIDFSLRTDLTVHGKTYYSPARLYMANGDPGYPEEWDWEPLYGWIETINKDAIISGLLNLPKIGELIDESTIKLELYDFDDDGEFEDVDNYYESY